MGLPDALHSRRSNAGGLGHRTQRPVRRLMRRRFLRQAHDLGDAPRRDRRLSGQTGTVAKQAACQTSSERHPLHQKRPCLLQAEPKTEGQRQCWTR